MQPQVTIISPRPTGPLEPVRELWRHRRLVRFWGHRFLRKMYVRTWLGKAWIPLRPTLDVASRVLVFGAVLSVPSGGVPYILFLLVGQSAWELFERTAYWSTRAFELNRRFLRRLYVPRLTLLAGSTAPALVNYAVLTVLTGIAVAWFVVVDGVLHLELGSDLWMVPAGLGLALALALSMGLWLCILGARARDVRFTLSYVLGFWLYLTPVVYPLSEVPAGLRSLVQVNPMTAPIELVKQGVLGVGQLETLSLVCCLGAIGGIGTTGLWFFARADLRAVDAL